MSAVASFQEIRRLRRSGLITLTLIDLLIVVVFVLLLFTFRSSEEDRAEIGASEALRQQLEAERDRLRRELTETRLENERLKRQIHDLQEFVQRLLNEREDPTLPADPGAVIAGLEAKARDLQATIDSLNRILQGLVQENEQLQQEAERLRELVGGQQKETNGQPSEQHVGPGYPRCLITTGFLLRIGLLQSGNLTIAPMWEPAADRDARAVPGVSELVDAGEVSLESFSRYGDQILAWSDAQDVPCRFRVDTRVETSDLNTFQRQMGAIDRYFYPKRY